MSKCWANIDKVKGSSNTTLNVFFDKNATGENRMVKISISNLEKNISKEVVLVQKATSDMFFGEYSETFKKNDCANGGEGSDVILTEKDLDCYPVISFVSQEDANEKAKKLLIENGQAIANSKGYCTWSGKYSHKFVKECGPCKIGEEVTVSEEYMDGYPFLSTLSKEDADSIAKEAVLNDGQSVANDIGRCSDMFKGEYEKVFYKQDCEECMSDKSGYVVKAEMTSGYPYCDTDEMSANNRAKLAVEAEGQEIANKNSTCVRIQGEPVWVDQGEVYCNGCNSVITQIDTNKCSPTYNSFREINKPGVDCSQEGTWSEWEVFCDGYTEKRRRVNSCGANQEEILKENSEECGYVADRGPIWEKVDSSYCENCIGYQKYKDMNPNSLTYGNIEIREDSSKECSNTGNWTDWDTYCDGNGNLRKSRVNSCGSTEDELVEENSEECKEVVTYTSTKTNTTAYRKTEGCECSGEEVPVGSIEATATSTNSQSEADQLATEKANQLAKSKADSLGCGTVYYNKEVTKYKEGCGSDCVAPSYTVKAGVHKACTQDEAQTLADNEAQRLANSLDCDCTYYGKQSNSERYCKDGYGEYAESDQCVCPGGCIEVNSVFKEATSKVSQENADSEALRLANEEARRMADELPCGMVWYSLPSSIPATKNNCEVGCESTTVYYPIPAGIKFSCQDQAHADSLRDAEMATRKYQDLAQAFANENAECICKENPARVNVYVRPSKSGYVSFMGTASISDGMMAESINVQDISSSVLVADNEVKPGNYYVNIEGSASMRCTTSDGEAETESSFDITMGGNPVSSSTLIQIESGKIYDIFITVESDCSNWVDPSDYVCAPDYDITSYRRSDGSCVSEFKDGCTGKPYIYHVDGCLFKAATEEEAIQKRNEWIYSDEAKILIQNKADEEGECNCPAYDSCDISIDSDVYIKASIDSGQIYAEVFHKISNVSCNPGGCGSFEFNMSMQRDGTSDMVEYGRIPYSCGETTDKFIGEPSYVDGYYIYPVYMRLPDEYIGEPDGPNYYGDLSYTVRTYSSHDDISSVSGVSHEINLRVQDVFDNGPDYIYRE